jgi:hypothetical protein
LSINQQGFTTKTLRAFALCGALAVVGCGVAPSQEVLPDGGTVAVQDAGHVTPDAGTFDAGIPVNNVDKSANCSSNFGSALTAGFGRIDGTVLAVVKPSDSHCSQTSRDHIIVEVEMHGAVYRLLANVHSTRGSPDVLLAEVDAPLPGDAWQEGWHTNANVDYPSTFGIHSTSFTSHPKAELTNIVNDRITVGAQISIFGQTTAVGSFAGGAHLIHRNGGGRDGAIVVNPTSPNAHALLFHFGEQTF